ncbi:MAG TPA: thioredoxin domain-containing protein [Opitutus sp.]|nr:thioredoxin domain-containing protein [Opitutus sp.]
MANLLAHEKSPYLLQHAENPVHWRPWGEAAFAAARAEQKPIFLSIGYATCHWCHVMAHESFEDAGVAALLNGHFVPIKVDREERPDVDKVYMTYVQAMTGHGGWPLSAWLTPELKPFYGGTYFPPEDRGGRAGFGSILRAIANGWANERDKLVAESERVIRVLREHAEPGAESPESRAQTGKPADVGSRRSAPGARLAESAPRAFEQCFQYFYEAFDAQHGGFGGAPKFPRAAALNFLLRAAALQGVESDAGQEAVRMATATLQAMARGGIHDHVGGGFHRYSVDEAWFVPHFEKMLYDQAQIALNALEARQATGDERFAWMARDIFDYVQHEMAHPDGGFYSAEDADSALPESTGRDREHRTNGEAERHAEGAFYVWTRAEIAAALGSEGELFCAHFGVTEEGNVPSQLDPQGELRGKNVLVQRRSLAETARQFSLAPQDANDRVLAALAKLREVRRRRPRPLRDDKIITAWNGLMISALAKGASVLEGGRGRAGGDSPAGGLLAAATRTAEFVQRELFDVRSGALFRSWREGRGAAKAFAEDYAFLIQGLLDLYEAGFEVRWLAWAEQLQTAMDVLFWDEAGGGYFNSSAGDPSIVLRLKEDYDGAEPAASSVAAANLLRLATMTGNEMPGEAGVSGRGVNYRERGRRCIEGFWRQWSETPQAMPQMLCALELALDSPRHVVLAGDPRDEDFRALADVVHERLGPRRVLLAADAGEGQRWLAERAPWIAGMKPAGGRATAYVCEDFACQAPVTEPAELRALLWRA